MRNAKNRNARTVLARFVLALLLAQLVLDVLIENAWPNVRDPEWHLLVGRLRQLLAEAPNRPLVVVLGSSRSELAVNAAWLSRLPSGPVVFNASVPAAGPLMQRVLLQRLLAQGIRPDLIVFEVMPPYFSDRGATFEESIPAGPRLNLAELRELVPDAREPTRLIKGWLKGRLLPLSYHQVALLHHLFPSGLCPVSATLPGSDRDRHGWKCAPECSAARRARLTKYMLGQYDRAIRSPTLHEPRIRHLERLLTRCQKEGIGCILFVPPENSGFRSNTAASLRTSLDAALAKIARKHGVPLYDARDWLSDEEFMDGHHATGKGAARFTARFEVEAFVPFLKARLASRGR
jgi:hypothetical protein